jgi:hypothetical protein
METKSTLYGISTAKETTLTRKSATKRINKGYNFAVVSNKFNKWGYNDSPLLVEGTTQININTAYGRVVSFALSNCYKKIGVYNIAEKFGIPLPRSEIAEKEYKFQTERHKKIQAIITTAKDVVNMIGEEKETLYAIERLETFYKNYMTENFVGMSEEDFDLWVTKRVITSSYYNYTDKKIILQKLFGFTDEFVRRMIELTPELNRYLEWLSKWLSIHSIAGSYSDISSFICWFMHHDYQATTNVDLANMINRFTEVIVSGNITPLMIEKSKYQDMDCEWDDLFVFFTRLIILKDTPSITKAFIPPDNKFNLLQTILRGMGIKVIRDSEATNHNALSFAYGDITIVH